MPSRPYAGRSHRAMKMVTKVSSRVIAHLALLAGGAIFVFPLLFMLSTSLKALRQIQVYPPIWIPSPVIWRNYPEVFRYIPFDRYLLNTLLIAMPWVLGAVVTSSLAAYAFARLPAPGRNVIFVLLLTTMMVPGMVRMIPTYLLFSWLGWVDTYLPLVIPALFGSAVYIFLLRQFFMTIPMELEDAALIDGAGWFTIWWRIMLPLAQPALATVSIFAFTGAWNDFMGPLIYLNNRKLYTLALGLQAFNPSTAGGAREWGLMMAASTMMTAPIILLFFVAQRQFVQGITLTGMGGR
jgi:ABC-type glycerol-3-phosphate transport system permease component